MGAIVARDVVRPSSHPRVGLLNIGEEDIKGHEIVQAAHALLRRSGLNYVGFVEGDDIFSGDVDVVVTDGFTGNVALKTMEGVARLIADAHAPGIQRLLARQARGPGRAAGAAPGGRRLDPRRYNGACMVGLGRDRGKKPRRRRRRGVRAGHRTGGARGAPRTARRTSRRRLQRASAAA